jgi:hypothetical protein
MRKVRAMLLTKRTCVAVVVLAAVLFAGQAWGQPPKRHQRLTNLQQQNALFQQQNAVQMAVQQTTSTLQSTNLSPTQTGMPNPITLQQQQIALQIAIQQTTALLQASYRQNNALSQMALGQLNTLQGVQQQTASLQNALPTQGGKLTGLQLQQLSQEQTSLLGLLTSQLPPLPGKSHR